jgi:hypothetical protein
MRPTGLPIMMYKPAGSGNAAGDLHFMNNTLNLNRHDQIASIRRSR